MTCSSPECWRLAHRKGLCRGHYERARKERPTETPLAARGTPWERLVRAAIDYADAEEGTDREAWARARERLRKGAVAYAESTAGRSVQPG